MLISNGDAKITKARSPRIPAPITTGFPARGPSGLELDWWRSLANVRDGSIPDLEDAVSAEQIDRLALPDERTHPHAEQPQSALERRDARELRIEVRDRRPGIPEDQLETVFEPFFRLEGSRSRASGGFGLGLSIARNIARWHGGDVTLRNAPGGGLIATLRLPRGTPLSS